MTTNKTAALIAILVLAILVVAIVFFNRATPVANDIDTTNGETPNTPAEQPEGTTYSDTSTSGWDISFNHPENIRVSRISGTLYELMYIGPESEPNTEITDGWYMSIEIIPEAELETYGGLDAALGDPEETTQSGRTALSYETASELGPLLEHRTFELTESGPVVDIAIMVAGDRRAEYREDIGDILSTLSFDEA